MLTVTGPEKHWHATVFARVKHNRDDECGRPVLAIALALSGIVANTLLALTAVAVSPLYRLVARRSHPIDIASLDQSMEIRWAEKLVVMQSSAATPGTFIVSPSRAWGLDPATSETLRTLH